MKHFFDAVADNVALQEDFEHTLPRTRDQVKEQLIRPIDQARIKSLHAMSFTAKATQFSRRSTSGQTLPSSSIGPPGPSRLYLVVISRSRSAKPSST